MMPEVWTPTLIVSVAIAVFLMGFSKTAMPVAGVLAGPVLAAALTPTGAAGFAVPLLILGDVFGLALYRQHADWGLIRRLIPGVLVGFAFTALLFRFVETGLLSRILGVLIIISVVLEVRRLRSDGRTGAKHAEMTNRAAIAFYGTLAGMTSMAANAGGTAMSVYLVKMRVSMLAFMGTSVWFFFILNVIKVPVVIGLG
ncbi:MAG: sulfite exporter TauE/SafE family protein, partial [Actinobacteria bacterium]|nr:sulfite exporter TauE/SafE family protein [Actinomycetota bacterium]